MLKLVHVGEDKITLKGTVPEIDPNYDGKDPLDKICWQIKAAFLTKYNVCVYYQIDRKLNLNGERTIDISFLLSYTGRYDGCSRVVADELHWKNMFSIELAALLDEFIDAFNRGEKCERIKDPERSLKLDPRDYQEAKEKDRKKKKKKKKKLQTPDASSDATAKMEAAGFHKATDEDLALPDLPDDILSDDGTLPVLPDEYFVDEDKDKN